MGPGPSCTWGEMTPLSRVITPVTNAFSAIYRGPITPLTTGSDPPCRELVNLRSQKTG